MPTRRSFLAAASTGGVAAATRRSPRRLISFLPRWTSPYVVDPATRHHLVNGEGKHLFLLNKTAWAYFGCRDPKGFLERARQQGVNVLRVALEGRPYWDHLKIDLWPWGGSREKPDWSRFNEAYWAEVERRVRLAGEAGFGLNVVLYFTLRPGTDEVEVQRRYWRQVLARLGHYANVLTWEIQNEYLNNEAFQDAAGSFLAKADSYSRPVCTSDGTTDDAAWPEKPWMGFALVHTCTGSGAPYTLRDWYLPVARNVRSHGKPAYNNETGREKRHRNDDPVHRRKQSWVWCCSGAYWTWHSWEGCEGIDDAAYRAPGGEFLRPLVTYFESSPFWRFEPNFTSVNVADPRVLSVVLATPDRSELTAYLCLEESGTDAAPGKARVRLPRGAYEAEFFRPADLVGAGAKVSFLSAGLGKPGEIAIPGFTDDILIRIRQTRRGTPAVIEGTR